MDLQKKSDIYLEYCKKQKELDAKTIKAYRIDLQQFIEFMDKYNQEIDKKNINQYLNFIHEKYKHKTIKRKIACIKAFFKYMEEEEIIDENPFRRVKTKFKEEIVLPKIISKNVIEQLLDYLYHEAEKETNSIFQKKQIIRDIAVIETLFATGLRISELCHLKDKAFDMNEGVLCINGKGKKERYIQIGSDDVIGLLRKYRMYFEKEIMEHGFFFVNRKGKPISEQSARNMIHKYTKLLWKDVHITPHMFRHSFATYLMEEDVNIRYIQKLLGHASITTTQIYTHVAMEKEREILRMKHPRNHMQIKSME